MKYLIRELRDKTGMTQSAFASRYGIPLSTLRKWEQGESSPAPYIINLIAETIPATNSELRKIPGKDGRNFYYDQVKKVIFDGIGNEIRVSENLDTVKEQNLQIYLEDLFSDFYSIQNKFNNDCRLDREEAIIWRRLDT